MPNTLHPRLIPVLGFLVCTGCAVNVNLNANRFESPETAGERLGGSVEVSAQGSNTLLVTPDPAGNPLQDSSPGWDRSNLSMRLNGSIGLFERFDIGIKAPANGPLLVLGKFQFLGAPLARTQAGNLAMAVTFGAGTTQPSSDSSNSATGISSHTSLGLTVYDAALIAGWRPAEQVMLYGGPFITSFSFSGTINQTGTVSHLFPVQGSGTQSGANLGVQFDSVLGAIKVEEAWALASIGGVAQSGFFTGGSFGIRF